MVYGAPPFSGFCTLSLHAILATSVRGEFAGKVGEQFTVRDGDALTTDEVYDTLTALIYKDRRCRPTGRRFITTYEIPTERVFEVLVIELNQVERGFDGAVLLCERKHRASGTCSASTSTLSGSLPPKSNEPFSI